MNILRSRGVKNWRGSWAGLEWATNRWASMLYRPARKKFRPWANPFGPQILKKKFTWWNVIFCFVGFIQARHVSFPLLAHPPSLRKSQHNALGAAAASSFIVCWSSSSRSNNTRPWGLRSMSCDWWVKMVLCLANYSSMRMSQMDMWRWFCLDLLDIYLMKSRISVKATVMAFSCKTLKHLINEYQREMIFPNGRIQFSIVYANFNYFAHMWEPFILDHWLLTVIPVFLETTWTRLTHSLYEIG